jgi:hypothetical protein
MWVLLILVGIPFIIGLVLRWWALIIAPLVMILGSMLVTVIQVGDLSEWGGNDLGPVGSVVLLGLPAIVGAAVGAIVREVSRARASRARAH